MARPINPEGTWTVTANKKRRLKQSFRLADGQTVRKSFTATTKDACRDLRDEWMLANGLDPVRPTAPARSMPTLDQWIVEVRRTDDLNNLEAATVSAAASLYRNHLKSQLGNRLIDTITATDVVELQIHLKAKGMSASTVRAVHVQLAKALNLAVRRGHLTRNVAADVAKPAPAQRSPQPFSQTELLAVWNVVIRHRDSARWAAQLMTGGRQSECLGLAWGDFNLEENRLIIKRSLKRVQWLHGCDPKEQDQHTPAQCPHKTKASQFGKTKSAAGVRAIWLPDQLVEVLRDWRVDWERAAKRGIFDTSILSEHGGLVFPSSTTGGARDHRADARQWQAILHEAEVLHRGTHSSRHTVATQLLTEGIDPRIVQEALGWSDGSQLPRYQHVTTSLTKKAGKAIENQWDQIIGRDADVLPIRRAGTTVD
ncbi:site-specific integrase [Yimella sp. RIT 621]|uniref:tyrosine-type recombinase/integrase n=1 Tax=Yimella sp. RIT 621 TaxID=2510323 RepID=UPI00101C805A|nr:tyrosine-type recombinase/integrase [Yimella sp. RIT 621]RYG78786.1 site-specific integrase [Yimella sp. RIT 621]